MSPKELIDIEKEIITPDDIEFVKGVGKTIKADGKYRPKRDGSVHFRTQIHCEENNLPVIKKVTIIAMAKAQNYRLDNVLILPSESESGDSLLDYLMQIPIADPSKRRDHFIESESAYKPEKLENIRFAICDRLNGATDYKISRNGMGFFWTEPNMGQIIVKY